MDAASLIGLSQFGQPTLGELAGSHADVVAELHDLSPVQTAATFSGLLVRPELQANCLRVEALAHFAAMHSCGSKAPTQGFVRRSFDCLSEGYCGMAEDPVEDLFVRLVSTPNGNFRVFEGIREANAFHLQNILNVVEGMPTGGPFEQLCVSIDSLLKISDLVAQRAGVLENILGKEFPLKSLPADLIADPSRLRRLVRFTARDLDRLQIQRDTLAEFALDFQVAEQLADFRGEVKPTGKPDLLRRHLNRIEVLNANTDAVAKKLKLTVPISVEGHLVFKNPVPMQYAWDHLASRIKLSIFSELHQL